MQSTCINWENIWTVYGLVSPHPYLQSIDRCDKFYCTNRHYIINAIEPFLVVQKKSPIIHIVLFMTFLTPVRFVWSVAQIIHLKTIARLFIQLERALVFWCDCEAAEKQYRPLICIEYHKYDRTPTEPFVDNLYVWLLLSLIISVPVISSCVGLLMVAYIYLDIYY
jgi:hypothetical protein